MKSNRWLGLAALAATLQIASAADITGKVTLKGTPPPEKELPVADGFCGPGSTAKVFKGRVFRTAGDGGLADVVVYLKDAPAGGAPRTTPAELDQKGCQYEPYVQAIQVGEPVKVKNSDPVLHNVHTRPTVAANKEQNLAQMPGSKDLEFKFAAPEQFMRVECNVHPYMVAYISVIDSPYFAVTDKDGNFTIKNVPKGNYTVVAAHRRAGSKEEKVTVGDSNAKADFSLDVPK